jgi:dephospho-CoA kinase
MKTIQIGITGGIGSGKSMICRILAIFGVPIYEADSRAKALMQSDTELMAAIKTAFGEKAYQDGVLNRKYLAAEVFENTEKLNLLNSLVHPAVERDYEKWYAQYDGKCAYTAKEAALLFESSSYKRLDYIVTIDAPIQVRISRVAKRDTQRTVAEIEAIISKQMSEEQRQSLAHEVILNDEFTPLLPQVIALHKKMQAKSFSTK